MTNAERRKLMKRATKAFAKSKKWQRRGAALLERAKRGDGTAVEQVKREMAESRKSDANEQS